MGPDPLTRAGEDLPGHEGYPAAVLDDGAELSTWTGETEHRTVGYRAVCECGWRGSTVRPGAQYPDEAAQRLIMAEWDDHTVSLRRELERVAGLAELAESFAELRRTVRAAITRGATAAEVAQALGVREDVVDALVGHG
ncbi:MAG: hypothetical protein ACRD0L_01565 [Acidimicrobiales bacterium]